MVFTLNQNEFSAFLFSSAIIFEDSEVTKSLTLHIKDDDEAELTEHVTFQMTSVHLVNRTLDPSLGMPPSIDVERSLVNVTIGENDHPYGVIGFERSRVIFHEWEGLVRIPVIREGMLDYRNPKNSS